MIPIDTKNIISAQQVNNIALITKTSHLIELIQQRQWKHSFVQGRPEKSTIIDMEEGDINLSLFLASYQEVDNG
jgi:hypothetical protein